MQMDKKAKTISLKEDSFQIRRVTLSGVGFLPIIMQQNSIIHMNVYGKIQLTGLLSTSYVTSQETIVVRCGRGLIIGPLALEKANVMNLSLYRIWIK